MLRESDTLSTTDRQYKLMQEYNDLLREQNYLLQKQNYLLQKQNKLAQETTSTRNDYGREILLDNIDRDEMRSGYLVTSHRKKLWNVQLNLIKEFDRICKKHNLRWFAIGGTLLGAARHKGFIPWDFDVDVIMFRPDYEKFQQVAANEVTEPYFLDIWYDYLLESEGATLADVKGNDQFITKEQEQTRPSPWFSQWPSIRLRDNRTTMIEITDRPFINQGIWLDIFPLDPLPPFADKNDAMDFNVATVLLTATAIPARIRNAMQKQKNLLLKYEDLEDFLSKPYRERGKIFEDFMNKHFFMSERIGDIRDYCITNNRKFYQSKDFTDVTYLPFEKIEVPAPVGYDSVLTDFYGDWRKPVIVQPHVSFYSADFSYKEYFQKAAFK